MHSSHTGLLPRSQRAHNGEFLHKFEGRITQINKEGHLGVVARTEKPIEKMHNLEVIDNPIDKHIASRVKKSDKRINGTF